MTNHGYSNYSDWSAQEADDGDAPLYFRISRIGCPEGSSAWPIEQAAQPVPAGIYTCSPQGEGDEAHFDFLKIEAWFDDRTQVYT
ncbi:hypothetical protein ABU162_20485 [Paenibacillus thiaminolyticus]|uniref:hypothetical protein n=1 Tax=Paenibacillus thiaminolyticus TaxID=49283 RepID=UPI0035A70E02